MVKLAPAREVIPLPPAPQTQPPKNSTTTPDGIQRPCVDREPGESSAAAMLKSAQYAANSSHPLNTCAVPGTSNGRLACAYAVNEIVENAMCQPITNSLGTADMNAALQSDPRFTRVPGGITAAQPGDIIISPTQGSNTGHVGICETAGCGNIISNSSSRARVEDRQTANAWVNYYGNKKHLPIIIYRPNG